MSGTPPYGYYSYGRSQGYKEGYQDGCKSCYRKGYDEGYRVGYNDGYNKGHSKGYREGYNEGYTKGKNDGYNEGFQEGYESHKRETLKFVRNKLFDLVKVDNERVFPELVSSLVVLAEMSQLQLQILERIFDLKFRGKKYDAEFTLEVGKLWGIL